MNIAQLLLEIDNEYNLHKQTILKGLSVEEGIEICKQLEAYTNNAYGFVVELWTEGDFSIYQKDYWKQGEHPLGHTDRMILGTSG